MANGKLLHQMRSITLLALLLLSYYIMYFINSSFTSLFRLLFLFVFLFFFIFFMTLTSQKRVSQLVGNTCSFYLERKRKFCVFFGQFVLLFVKFVFFSAKFLCRKPSKNTKSRCFYSQSSAKPMNALHFCDVFYFSLLFVYQP